MIHSSNSPYDISTNALPTELISPIDYQTNISVNSDDRGTKFDNEISYCHSCRGPILDRVVLKVGSSTWHVRCLCCTECGVPLIDKCYSKNDEIYCKEDFYRRHGTRCAACDEVIPPAEVIRKAQNFIYHIDCFSCISCHRQLNTGEEFFLLPSKKLMCRPDFEIAKAKELDQGNKRPRTTITAKQLEALKKTYSESSKPARHVREQLSAKTGLDMRVVQVWFQNRRAKEKRMKKDASRGCWNTPYFQNTNSNCKVSSLKGDSDEQSDDQTNEPVDITYQSDVESDSDVFSCYGAPSNTNVTVGSHIVTTTTAKVGNINQNSTEQTCVNGSASSPNCTTSNVLNGNGSVSTTSTVTEAITTATAIATTITNTATAAAATTTNGSVCLKKTIQPVLSPSSSNLGINTGDTVTITKETKQPMIPMTTLTTSTTPLVSSNVTSHAVPPSLSNIPFDMIRRESQSLPSHLHSQPLHPTNHHHHHHPHPHHNHVQHPHPSSTTNQLFSPWSSLSSSTDPASISPQFIVPPFSMSVPNTFLNHTNYSALGLLEQITNEAENCHQDNLARSFLLPDIHKNP